MIHDFYSGFYLSCIDLFHSLKHIYLQIRYKELVDKYTIEYIAGGATQNSMRVFQWIVQTPNVSSYFGCVGKDKYADILDNIARKAGVNVQYQIDESTETGLCAALLSGKSRYCVEEEMSILKFIEYSDSLSNFWV